MRIKDLSIALRICPLDVDKSLMQYPSNNCIFPYKIVKTLVNFTKFDFFIKVLFELMENGLLFSVELLETLKLST